MTARLTYAELLAERREYVAYTRKLNDEIAVMAVHRGRLLSALRRALLVIEDEVNIYAPEHCDAKRVSEARARHAKGGTLAYYAAAISAMRKAMNDQRGAAALADENPTSPQQISAETIDAAAPHHPPEPQK